MGGGEERADVLLLAILLGAGLALGLGLGDAWFGVSLALGIYLFVCARRWR